METKIYEANKHKAGFLSHFTKIETSKLESYSIENLCANLKGICRANSAAGCN